MIICTTNNTTFCLVNEIESLSPVPHEGTVSMWFWIIPVFIVRISFNFVNNGRTNHVFPTFYVIIVHIQYDHLYLSFYTIAMKSCCVATCTRCILFDTVTSETWYSVLQQKRWTLSPLNGSVIYFVVFIIKLIMGGMAL
jgi:hypothetical protein